MAAGTVTEGDFAGAVVGEPYGTSHPACGARFRVIELAPTIPLFSDDLKRSRAHSYRNGCPACGARFTGNALEFITPETSFGIQPLLGQGKCGPRGPASPLHTRMIAVSSHMVMAVEAATKAALPRCRRGRDSRQTQFCGYGADPQDGKMHRANNYHAHEHGFTDEMVMKSSRVEPDRPGPVRDHRVRRPRPGSSRPVDPGPVHHVHGPRHHAVAGRGAAP